MNWLIKNFLRGLVIVLPMAATIWVIYAAFTSVDRLLPMRVPGLGLVVILAAIVAVGVLASNFVIHRLLRMTEALFKRAPLVRIIYASVKDLLEAFVGDKRRFDRPVAVALSEGVTTLGFVTQKDLGFLAMPGRVAVYCPFSYSVAGIVMVVLHEQFMPLDADCGRVLALVVSGGVSRV
jgi:uncharacterized membrane protein